MAKQVRQKHEAGLMTADEALRLVFGGRADHVPQAERHLGWSSSTAHLLLPGHERSVSRTAQVSLSNPVCHPSFPLLLMLLVLLWVCLCESHKLHQVHCSSWPRMS